MATSSMPRSKLRGASSPPPEVAANPPSRKAHRRHGKRPSQPTTDSPPPALLQTQQHHRPQSEPPQNIKEGPPAPPFPHPRSGAPETSPRTAQSAPSGNPTASASCSEDPGADLGDQSLVDGLLNLELSAPHLELSEEQQAINRQEQEDEVLALEAIFGEDFVLLGTSGSFQEYMVSVHVDLPSEINVSVKLHNDARGAQSYTSVHACTLQFLPPMQLIFKHSISYPSHSPPDFIISARWLTGAMISSLCVGLDALWEQQVGNVVVYSWTEWLRTSCFSHLEITNGLELDTLANTTHDRRARSGFLATDVDIPWLINFNEEQKHIEFSQKLHTCFICFTEQPGKNFVKLACKHHFCAVCMEQYLKINIKEGAVKKLLCPDVTCKSAIPPTIIKQVIGEDDFNRWDALLLQRTLDAMCDVVYCPRCNTACLEDKDHHAQCSNCLFSFCSLCCTPRHVGQECMPAEVRLKILQDRLGSMSGLERRKQEQDFRNELLNMRYLDTETKKCPACKMAISKTEGCNKMTCGNCGQYFCWICNKAIKGYDHFREACTLFDEADIQQWEQQLWHGGGPPPLNENRIGARFWHPCPRCRQPNLKEGNNNHLFCWSCQQHFCALCRKVVRRSSEHFGSGPNKCKQHTHD